MEPAGLPTAPLRTRAPLGEVAGRARPVALAGERLLPVLAALEPVLPERGLRRGSVVAVAGSTSLALALVAGASAAGSWAAAAGLPSLGPAAAARLGIALDRFPVVAVPPGSWAWAVAALLDAVDVVVAGPPARLAEGQARRLAARARERSSVLVVAGGWPGADVRLEVAGARWEGVGRGHGRLRARRLEVVGGGRGAAARERRVVLWLPAPGGGVAALEGEPAGAAGPPVAGPDLVAAAGRAG